MYVYLPHLKSSMEAYLKIQKVIVEIMIIWLVGLNRIFIGFCSEEEKQIYLNVLYH